MTLLERFEVLVAEQKACEELAARPDGGQPEPLWWRVAIAEPGGRTVEIDTPSGWTFADWQAYAERHRGPGCAMTPIAGLPKPRAPVNIDEALRTACDGVAGITPAQFRALMSPADIDDIAAGAIHPKTLRGYAQLFAEGVRSGRIGAPRAGVVDSLPFRTATVHVREVVKPDPVSGGIVITEADIEAARKGRTVVRQGDFTGAQEVKGEEKV
jgi:hypothetical protein